VGKTYSFPTLKPEQRCFTTTIPPAFLETPVRVGAFIGIPIFTSRDVPENCIGFGTAEETVYVLILEDHHG